MKPLGVFVGLSTVDILYEVERLPHPGEKIICDRQAVFPGGTACNAALAFARRGGRARLVTGIGRHPLASVIRHELERFSVQLFDLQPDFDEVPTVSAALVAPGHPDRTVISNVARRYSLSAEAFDASVLDGAQVLEVDGHHMPVCMEAARQARLRSIPVVLDGGSWKDGMHELLALVDYALCSDDFRAPGAAGEEEVLGFLKAQGAHGAAISRGPRSVLYSTPTEYGEVQPPAVKAVDPLGAGDIFHGTFCYAQATGRSFREAIAFACQHASQSCAHFGPPE